MTSRGNRRNPLVAAVCLLTLGGCGGGGGSGDRPPSTPPPPPPALVSLILSGDASVEEAGNPTVDLTIELDANASAAVTVALELAGTATRDSDYEIDAVEVRVPAGSNAASAEIDIFRDFDEEGDETIEISLGTIDGNAQAGDSASVTLTVLDGEAATVNKGARDDGGAQNGDQDEVNYLEMHFLGLGVREDEIVLTVLVEARGSGDVPPPEPMGAEWATDPNFSAIAGSTTACYGPDAEATGAQDVRPMDPCEIVPSDDPLNFFVGNLRQFAIPMAELEPNRRYFIRVWLAEVPPGYEFGDPYTNVVATTIATNAEGRLSVRCVAPERTPAPGGGDPLFGQQWHLSNTGQTAFSDRGGVAGADLRMSSAIDAYLNGAGVKLAVVDTGLEICHPDLAANTAGGGSFNFGADARPGSSPSDPFTATGDGDHGTSVAGVAAAAAGNGFGGRGVAPEVALVAFNPLETAAVEDADPESAAVAAMLKSLGASARDPDSASVDIFNMSFGAEAPSENAMEEFDRVYRMGVETLRSGRGALYVKAAGNSFDFCEQTHPFHREVGCIGANSDPDQNLPWLIAVGAFNADDVKSSYSSAGANLWVVGPGGEDGVEAPAMVTTDQAGAGVGFDREPENRLTSDHPLNRDGDYISAFGGTSSAAPAVAGALAILLGVKPELTWRDVKHILAATAREIDSEIEEVRAAFDGNPYIAQHAWQTNGAGYEFHNWYGFGAVDVDAAVAMAQSYTPESLGEFVESDWFGTPAPTSSPDASGSPDTGLDIPDADGAGVSDTIVVTGLPESANIEAVALEIAVEHGNALDLGVTLTSPSGMSSVVNPPLNEILNGYPGLTDWRLLSNAFYGENANGTWTVHVADIASGDTGRLTGWRLRIYYGEHP